MEVALVSGSSVDVELGRILPFDSSQFKFDGFVNSEQVRAAMVVLGNVFPDPPHVSLTVNCSVSLDFEVLGRFELDEVEHIFLTKRPHVVPFGSFKRAINSDGQVLDVISIHRHGVESHVGRDVDFPLVITRVVGSHNSLHYGSRVYFLGS